MVLSEIRFRRVPIDTMVIGVGYGFVKDQIQEVRIDTMVIEVGYVLSEIRFRR